MLSGRHAAATFASPEPLDRSWVADFDAEIITDDYRVGELPIVSQFKNQTIIPYLVPANACSDVEETAMGDLFAGGIEAIAEQAAQVTWMHLSSLADCWDAPRSLCFTDDEVQLPNEAKPPKNLRGEEVDPDQLLAWMMVYGGQVRLFDLLLGLLVESIDEASDAVQTMLVVVGTRGMSLGENGSFGSETTPHLSPALHVPLIVRVPGQAALRCPNLCQPFEVAETARRWLAGESAGLFRHATPSGWADAQSPEHWTISVDDRGDWTSFQTPWWHLVAGLGEPLLFRKPDDRFDVNDIAGRVPLVCEAMQQHAAAALQSLATEGERYRLSAEILSGSY